MSNYFEKSQGRSGYFSETTTSASQLKQSTVSSRVKPSIEPRSVLEKVVSNYGVKRSGVVIRRYGIK